MESGVSTKILITDANHKIISSSIKPDEDMKEHIIKKTISTGQIIENDWQEHKYIVSVSPVGKNLGYVYMLYPSSMIKDIIFVMSLLSFITSLVFYSFHLALSEFYHEYLLSPLSQ